MTTSTASRALCPGCSEVDTLGPDGYCQPCRDIIAVRGTDGPDEATLADRAGLEVIDPDDTPRTYHAVLRGGEVHATANPDGTWTVRQMVPDGEGGLDTAWEGTVPAGDLFAAVARVRRWHAEAYQW